MFYSGFSFGSFLCVSCIVLHFNKRWLQHLSALTKYISLEDFPTGTGSNSESFGDERYAMSKLGYCTWTCSPV